MQRSRDDDERAPTLVSDSLSLFKALQVRHEPIEPERARQRAQLVHEIYSEDENAQLVCYRHAEVLVYAATAVCLLLVMLTVSVLSCWHARRITHRHQLDMK